jgi:hypothetical protein
MTSVRLHQTVASASVGSVGQPTVEPLTRVVFPGRWVSVGKGGGLSDRWNADRIGDGVLSIRWGPSGAAEAA